MATDESVKCNESSSVQKQNIDDQAEINSHNNNIEVEIDNIS